MQILSIYKRRLSLARFARQLLYFQVVQGYATQREAEEAVSIIQSQDWSTGHPFFLYLAWHAQIGRAHV